MEGNWTSPKRNTEKTCLIEHIRDMSKKIQKMDARMSFSGWAAKNSLDKEKYSRYDAVRECVPGTCLNEISSLSLGNFN